MNKLTLALLALLINFSLYAQNYQTTSPDKNITLKIEAGNLIHWSVEHNGKAVIDKSEISMTVNDEVLGEHVKVRKKTENSIDETLTPIVALKTSSIKNNYNEITLNCKGNYAVTFRVFNDGVAYRFSTSFKNDITVNAEKLLLNFAENGTSFFPEEESYMSHFERSYIPYNLKEITNKQFCSLPVLTKLDDGVSVLFTEADLYDYPNLFFYGTGGTSFKANFPKKPKKISVPTRGADRSEVIDETYDYIAATSGTRTFPWRVLCIRDDKTLLENNLVFQLSSELKIEDPSWIKPGKVAWDWYNANNIYGVDFESGINTETYKYYIDFASEYGLEYIILDEGWTKTTTEVLATNPDIDIKELVSYGKSKNVDIILWLLWKPLDKNLEEILKTYHEWGIKGIKVDFMQRADQDMVNYYERVAKTAAKYELLVDFHGAYKPAGLRRAYPNVISYEGVKGNENNKWSQDITPEHNVTLPFIRMQAGPMDFTPGAMTNVHLINHKISHYRPEALGTRAHQVAMYVVFESPLQMLCDAPSAYYKEKETTEFITQIPSVWDETIALQAQAGDYVAIARRKGDKWYIGAMTDDTAREMEISFDFLGAGNYKAEIIQDGVNADKYAQDYKKTSQQINKDSKLTIKLTTGGGWAAILTKK
ncbi:glycoside hydrolase family 97 protein [Chondrinema litorale]|uniref:glycoside hydrolase family 97 protein n=1 Tax=Chondrinema litorale TaxID=2994555 RepID=UPI0025436BF1|nr:glycoside hydrolase family 97 protein [Chondrinema litorale]UZR94576.1 glycoside hydrolase family 97 protein [Chondrinema litorale]